MKIKGKLHRITNIQTFVASFLGTGGKPTTGFANFGKAKIHVATDAPLNSFSNSFIPNMSFKADANANGDFTVEVPDGLKSFRGRLIAYDVTLVNVNLPGVPSIEILSPLYRSASFKLDQVNGVVQKIFVFPSTTPDDQGIPASEVNKEADKLKKSLKLNKVSASISSNAIKCTAEKSGGVIKFEIHPKPSTSSDLSELVRLSVEEMDIDLPGPDWITGLCVNKDDIEKQVRNGVKGFAATVNDQITAEIEKAAPGVTALATITISKIRYPVTSSVTIKVPGVGNQTFSQRSIVVDPTIGVPINLYA
jgi:hypothetical protein